MISMITAIDDNWAIGKDNQLLCHLPNDLKYFKQLTEGNIVVMGRKTFESVGKPLPNRINIVMTRDEEWNAEGVSVLHDIDDILEYYMVSCSLPDAEDMFIIGGGEIYKQFMPYVDTLHVTKIHNSFEGADAFFPPIPMIDWEVVEVTPNKKDSKNKYDHDFVVFNRRYREI